MSMYYPIIFEPIYKQTIWGGDRLHDLFGRELPFRNVGESWDISCRPNEMGIVKNGELSGLTFEQLIKKDPKGILGKALQNSDRFPLLIKLIDANDDLSVQVHPHGMKNEAWYIIFAPEGATLCAGLIPGTSKESFAAAMGTSEVENYLSFIRIKSGDVINIPTGTVHAIGAGLIIAEIQQNSDTTYRVYDYGRVDSAGNPRQLHIKQALDSIDFEAHTALSIGQAKTVDGGIITFHCQTVHYALYEYEVESRILEASDPDRFFAFTCIDGICEIRGDGFCTLVYAGDSVFIPAALGAYEIRGKCKLLKSFVP